MSPLVRFLCLAALLLAHVAAHADVAEEGRPRIGLVLGGGGARGFAHIGVLQVLEENRIPVHAVAGTSMGAVVGSLYASGLDSDQLVKVTRAIDWATLFSDRIPRDRMTFRRKRDERDNLIRFRLAFDNKGLVLPPGLLRGQDLYLTLAEKLATARSVRDFDDLPIPFRAVAADITTGQAVVLEDGDIATAVFASMAVPGGLPPVEREGRLLVDGGIVNNVPVDVARAMGVDRVIVVDVGTPLLKREDIRTFVNVLDQVQLLLGRAEIDRQLASLGPQDVLIRANPQGVSSTDFTSSEEAIAAGREAGRAMVGQLRALALDEAAWKEHLAARAARQPGKLPRIDFVEIRNDSDLPEAQIREMVRAEPGKPHDPAQMTADLNNVFATGFFRSVRYSIENVPNLGDGIVITATGDPSQANFFQLGLNLATDFNRQNEFGIGLAYTDRSLGESGIEWRTDIRVGQDILISSTFYREFGRFLVEAGPLWSRRDTLIFADGVPLLNVRTNQLGFRADGGYLIDRWGEVRVGLFRSGVRLDAGFVPLPDEGRIEDMSWRIQFTADRLDNVIFPTRGLFGEILLEDHVKAFGGELDYSRFLARFFKPMTRNRTTLVLAQEVGSTLSGDGLVLGDFRLGGFLRLSGLAPNEQLGRHYLLSRAVVYHRLFDKGPIVDVPVYVGGSVEVGGAFASWDDPGLIPAGSLFISTDTPLGPFTFAGGVNGQGQALYLILGRLF
ncbi:patatin-like phospholipase family protein [Thermaurantiacus sp.]